MDGAAAKNRPTQVFVAGCSFILVMCAIQVWRSNIVRGSLACGDEDPQFVIAFAEPDGDTQVEASALPPPVRWLSSAEPQQPVDGFSSERTTGQQNVPNSAESLSAQYTQTSFEPTLPGHRLTDQSLLDAIESPALADSQMADSQMADSLLANARPQNVEFDIEQQSEPPQLGSLRAIVSNDSKHPDFDSETALTQQFFEVGQTLEPAPPVAMQVERSTPRIEDVAVDSKATKSWRREIIPGLKRNPDLHRDQQRLDRMIDDFQQQSQGPFDDDPSARPIYEPGFDPEPIVPKPEPSAPQPDAEPAESIPAAPEKRLAPESDELESEPEADDAPDESQPAPRSAWIRPTRLLRELTDLPPVDGVKQWTEQVTTELAKMDQLQSISDPATTTHLTHLRGLVEKSRPISMQLSRMDQVAMRQAAYSLTRRIDVWAAAHRSAQPPHSTLPYEVYRSVQPHVMIARVAEVRQGLANPRIENAADWSQYMLLDELQQAANGQGSFIGPARVELAQIVLDRLTDPDLTAQQKDVLAALGTEQLGQELRIWATHPVSQHGLLQALERFEHSPTNPLASADLANLHKDLQWSAVPSQNNLAVTLDQHYRNANVRVSVNEEMLNRMVPAVREFRQPVQDQVLGARVQGHSETRTRIFVRLLPDRGRLRFMFEARGVMAARTAATKGPVTLLNRNNSNYNVRKIVMMDQNGPRFGRSQAVASGNSNLLGMQTNYDGLPIIGQMVRRIARKQHSEQAGLARRIFVDRVEEQARQQVDRQIESQLASARQQLEQKLITPLRRLDLNPRAMDMQTLQGRMILRGRLAADHQLAAHTARPQAHSGSFLTMQVHESAVNNFFQQLNLDGREANLKELYEEISAQLRLDAPADAADVPTDVTIRFAEKGAVRVSIDDGVVRLKLRIRHLQAGEDLSWKNFEVTADYRPFRDDDGGVEFYFSRDGGISLSKRNLALRAVFTKALSQNRKIYLVNPELASDLRFAKLNVTQMEINDGWIGLSVGPGQTSPVVALRPVRTR